MAEALSPLQRMALKRLESGPVHFGNQEMIGLGTFRALEARGLATVRVTVRVETVNNSRDPFRGPYTRYVRDWTATKKET